MLDLEAPVDEVARALLGATLSAAAVEGRVTVRITETEAYAADDPASHAYRGPTRRNAVMFGPAGVLYVYRSHGLHWICNVTTGDASAVLLRAGEVVEGQSLARLRRGPVADRMLARGPGNLARALGVTGDDDGTCLTGEGRLRLTAGVRSERVRISAGPRTGISVAADVPWRFWLVGDPTVSPYRRSPRAPAGPS